MPCSPEIIPRGATSTTFSGIFRINPVRPFLERASDLNLLTKDNVLKLLAARSRAARQSG
jgi:hypothetical protein